MAKPGGKNSKKAEMKAGKKKESKKKPPIVLTTENFWERSPDDADKGNWPMVAKALRNIELLARNPELEDRPEVLTQIGKQLAKRVPPGYDHWNPELDVVQLATFLEDDDSVKFVQKHTRGVLTDKVLSMLRRLVNNLLKPPPVVLTDGALGRADVGLTEYEQSVAARALRTIEAYAHNRGLEDRPDVLVRIGEELGQQNSEINVEQLARILDDGDYSLRYLIELAPAGFLNDDVRQILRHIVNNLA